MKKALPILTMLLIIFFLASLIITFLYPEIVARMKLTPIEARTITMTLISLILLVFFLQTQLSMTWRIFCLISSFMVLIESILMLGSWEQFFK